MAKNVHCKIGQDYPERVVVRGFEVNEGARRAEVHLELYGVGNQAIITASFTRAGAEDLIKALRAELEGKRFSNDDLVEDLVHGWQYRLYNVDHTPTGAHACYRLVGGDHDGWDSEKIQGFFPYERYKLVRAS